MNLATPSRFRADDAPESAGLPARWYHDPAVFAREVDAIFLRSWQFAGVVHDLPEPGSYFTISILDQSIVVLRDRHERIRAYYNVCSHRGHEIVNGSGRAALLTCPYHAWSYDLDGRLKAAANAENVAGFDPAEFGLTEVRTELFANLVFVNFATDAPPLAQLAGDLAADFRNIIPDYDDLVPFRRDHYDIAANWKVVIENFNECYHCPVVHTRAMGETASVKPSWETEDCGFFSRHMIRANDAAADDLEFKFRTGGGIENVYLWSLWPNVCFVARPGASNFQIFHVMPTGAETCHETLVNFGCSDPPEAPELAVFDFFRDELNPEDIAVVESVQRGLKSRGFRGGRLMIDAGNSWRSEASVHHFDALVWRALTSPDQSR